MNATDLTSAIIIDSTDEPQRRRRNTLPWLVGSIIVVAATVFAFLAAGNGIPGRAVISSSITVSGIVMLTDYDGFTGHTSGSACYGDGGYDDLGLGTSVTVFDSTSSIIGGGSISNSNFNGTACVLSFEIAKIPSGRGFYQVEISHRGKISADEKDAEGGTLYFIGEIG